MDNKEAIMLLQKLASAMDTLMNTKMRDAVLEGIYALLRDTWHPVSEAPPHPVAGVPPLKEQTYLVQLDCGSFCQCRWTNENRFWAGHTTDWHWNFFDIPQYTKIVAWRELPELYKEERDEINEDTAQTS